MGVDPWGQNAQDVENMISWAGRNEPPVTGDPEGLLSGDGLRVPHTGWNPFGGWEWWHTALFGGWYSAFGDVTYYSSFYYPKDEELCCKDLVRLYQTVVHEALHRTLCKKRGYFSCNIAGVSDREHDWMDEEGVKRAKAQAPRIRETYCADDACPDAP